MTVLERKELRDSIATADALSQCLTETAVERDLKAGSPDEEVQQLRESGLLPLVVPTEYGGQGATWVTALKVTQILSRADGSIGQLYGNHLNLTALGHVSGTPQQKERFYRESAEGNLFWANAINTRDTRLKIEPEGDHFRVNGVKSFGTGVAIADRKVFAAVQEGVAEPVLFVILKEREGLVSLEDWDNFGQRRTDSNSFIFQNVWVNAEEVFGYPSPPTHAFATFLGIIAQLTKTYVYLGVAEGAFEAAQAYTRSTTQPWITSGVERAAQDPYILRHYGELWTALQGAITLADQTAQKVQTAWDKDADLTFEERGDVAITVFAAKSLATRVGLDLTTRIFEALGSRATATKYGFDRYWRDLRTFTLHDPMDYKLRDIGDWVLNQHLPEISQYS